MKRLLCSLTVLGSWCCSLASAQDCETYKLVQQTVYDERQVTAFRIEHETVFDEQQVTVQRPVYETEVRERRYTFARPVTETSEREELASLCCVTASR